MINPKDLANDDLYYASKDYMSSSLYKRMMKCELEGIQDCSSQSTPSMMFGSYVDRAIEGTLDKFKQEHPELFVSKHTDRYGMLKAEYSHAEDVVEFIKNDKVFSQFMSGEKQVVMTGEISGVPYKIKMDSYSPHIAINDLKVLKTVTNSRGDYIDFISPWGYDIQMAIYREIVYQNTGELLPTFICAVTKEDPINSVIVNIPNEILDTALYLVQLHSPHLWNVYKGKEKAIGCGKCKYCLAQRKETPIIDMYSLMGN